MKGNFQVRFLEGGGWQQPASTRRLSPHQFTPMSGAHKSVQAPAAARFRFLAFVFFIRSFCRAQSLSASVPDLCRSTVWEHSATVAVE
jgi:hypothetical protein